MEFAGAACPGRSDRDPRPGPGRAASRRHTRARTSRTGSSSPRRPGSRWRCATRTPTRRPPCTPESDSNAPTLLTAINCSRTATQGGGSAFMEMQLYPPGNPPVRRQRELRRHALVRGAHHRQPRVHQRASRHAIRLRGAGQLRLHPEQRRADRSARTAGRGPRHLMPNNQTLLMNPGDTITIHMSDAPAPGGGNAFEVVIDDLTHAHRPASCRRPRPTASMNTSISQLRRHAVQLPAGVQRPRPSRQHHPVGRACRPTSAPSSRPATSRPAPRSATRSAPTRSTRPTPAATYNECVGPVRERGPAGQHDGRDRRRDVLLRRGHPSGLRRPRHVARSPTMITGCQDNFFQNGDLDFDGTPYWTEWPTGLRPTIYPVQLPRTVPDHGGQAVPAVLLPDRHRAERVALLCTPEQTHPGPAAPVPPQGPGGFYPYWTQL